MIAALMISPKINILCAIDNNYAPYCGIMLTSLFENNKDCHFVVYIFKDGSVTEENIKKYQQLSKKYGNDIVFKTIDESMVKGFPMNVNLHITLPTYYRLLAAVLLPKDVHKIVYLDCDVIVLKGINLLWNVNLESSALAGVVDCTPFVDQACNRLGYSASYSYINAGVLVYNLDYWREKGVTERIISFISANGSNLAYMDQDALNGSLYNEKIILPSCYNFSTQFFESSHWDNYMIERQHFYVEESYNPVIVHYQGSIKPWNIRGYRGPFFYNWDKNRRISLWKNCDRIKPYSKYIAYKIKRYIYSIFFINRNAKWVVRPENRHCYKECIL